MKSYNDTIHNLAVTWFESRMSGSYSSQAVAYNIPLVAEIYGVTVKEVSEALNIREDIIMNDYRTRQIVPKRV